jgi:hypothetical protein
VHHLKQLELIDAQLFGDAVESVGAQATPVIQRDMTGAQDLDKLTAIVGPDRYAAMLS